MANSATPKQDAFPGCCVMLVVMLAIVLAGAALAFGNEPSDDTLRERCDRITVNHYWSETDEEGFGWSHKFVFSQILFQDWNGADFEIRAWRMVKPICRPCTEEEQLEAVFEFPAEVRAGRQKHDVNRSAEITPTFDHARGMWVCEWWDSGVVRRVEAPVMIEIWTDYDPEVTQRNTLSNGSRRELRQAVGRKR